jgi:hypothetical protein
MTLQTSIRLTLAGALIATVVGTSWALTRENDAAEHDPAPAAADAGFVPARFTSSKQCRECHQDVWDEWHGTQHQIAYENPEVRKLSNDFRTKECQACHLPKPVFQTGLAQRTLPRVTRPDEGVGCLSCHEGPDGRIVGRHTVDDAPCTPIAHTEFVTATQCETCHNQHGTTDQWRESPFFGKQDCADCHMPEIDRAGGRKGRSHVMPGGHDLATLKAAGRFELERGDDGAVVTRLTNVGAGHNYPTEERSRALDVLVRFLGDDGRPLAVAGFEHPEIVPEHMRELEDGWLCIYRYRSPYRDEPIPNTQLPSGESLAQTVTPPDGAARVEARLMYRRNPFAPDDHPEVLTIEERTLELR